MENVKSITSVYASGFMDSQDASGVISGNAFVISNSELVYDRAAITPASRKSYFLAGGGVKRQNEFANTDASSGDVTSNSVEFNNSATMHLFGGVVGSNYSVMNASKNTVIVNGDSKMLDVYGGAVHFGGASMDYPKIDAGSAFDNQVTINGGEIVSGVYGGYSVGQHKAGLVYDNKVIFNGGSAGMIYGGLSSGYNNEFYINSLDFGSGLDANDVTGNSVIITGGTIGNDTTNSLDNGNVYGGYSRGGFSQDTIGLGGNATNNSVTLIGENITIKGAIFGGYSTDGIDDDINSMGSILGSPSTTADVFTGNVLNLTEYRGSVKGIYNFEYYNWVLPKNVVSNDAALVHITGDDAVNLDNTKHTIAMLNDGNVLKAGDKVYLIDKATGTPTLTTQEVKQGQFIVYDMSMSVEGNYLVLTVGNHASIEPEVPSNPNIPNSPVAPVDPVRINPQSKAFMEGRAAALSFISSDFISSSMHQLGISGKNSTKTGLTPFIFTEGSSQRIKTGSSVNVKGFQMAVGVTSQHEMVHDTYATIGAFFEYGNGNYNSLNSFTNYSSVKGDGKIHYSGGGLLGRIDFTKTGLGLVSNLPASQADGLYLEASLRAGKVYYDFDSSDLIDPEGYQGQYDSHANYFGTHVSVGYAFNFNEKQSLDLYSRYLYMHMNSDNVTIGKDHLYFNSSNSSRLQLGGRYNYLYNSQVKAYVGATYDYEFNGDVKGKAYGFNLDSPSLKGSTGIIEAGLMFAPFETHKNIMIDLSGRGFIGQRQGGGGNIKITAEF